MTLGNILYLLLAVGGWFVFAAVVGWATHRTNPSPRVAAKRAAQYGSDSVADVAPVRG